MLQGCLHPPLKLRLDIQIVEFISKILLCGDGFVGKTSLRKSFMGFKFNSQYLMTIGAELSIISKKFEIDKDRKHLIKFFLWDLAGQPNFSTVRPRYYEGGNAAVLVYDITNRDSFNNIENWILEIKAHNSNFPLPLILVANKIDLVDKVDEFIPTSEGKELAEELSVKFLSNELKIQFIETSALTGVNVDSAFESLGKEFLQKMPNI